MKTLQITFLFALVFVLACSVAQAKDQNSAYQKMQQKTQDKLSKDGLAFAKWCVNKELFEDAKAIKESYFFTLTSGEQHDKLAVFLSKIDGIDKVVDKKILEKRDKKSNSLARKHSNAYLALAKWCKKEYLRELYTQATLTAFDIYPENSSVIKELPKVWKLAIENYEILAAAKLLKKCLSIETLKNKAQADLNSIQDQLHAIEKGTDEAKAKGTKLSPQFFTKDLQEAIYQQIIGYHRELMESNFEEAYKYLSDDMAQNITYPIYLKKVTGREKTMGKLNKYDDLILNPKNERLCNVSVLCHYENGNTTIEYIWSLNDGKWKLSGYKGEAVE